MKKVVSMITGTFNFLVKIDVFENRSSKHIIAIVGILEKDSFLFELRV